MPLLDLQKLTVGAELAGQEYADREPRQDDHPIAGVTRGPRLSEETRAVDEYQGAADRQGRSFGGEAQVVPAQGEDLCDARAGGEHEADGQVAGVPRRVKCPAWYLPKIYTESCVAKASCRSLQASCGSHTTASARCPSRSTAATRDSEISRCSSRRPLLISTSTWPSVTQVLIPANPAPEDVVTQRGAMAVRRSFCELALRDVGCWLGKSARRGPWIRCRVDFSRDRRGARTAAQTVTAARQPARPVGGMSAHPDQATAAEGDSRDRLRRLDEPIRGMDSPTAEWVGSRSDLCRPAHHNRLSWRANVCPRVSCPPQCA